MSADPKDSDAATGMASPVEADDGPEIGPSVEPQSSPSAASDRFPEVVRLIDVEHDGDITDNHEVYYAQWKEPEDKTWISMSVAYKTSQEAAERVRDLMHNPVYGGVNLRVVRIRTRQTLTVLQRTIRDGEPNG